MADESVQSNKGEALARNPAQDTAKPNFYLETLLANEKVTDPEILEDNARIAEEMGVSPPPSLYYSPSDVTTSTKKPEGKRYIIVDRAFSREELRGVLAHEMGHHALGHTGGEETTVEEQRMRERWADVKAVSVCEGENLALALEDLRGKQKAHAAEKGEALDTSRVAEDEDHPPLDERIAITRFEAKVMKAVGICPVEPALLASAVPGMKQVSGGVHVAQNAAPNAQGDKVQQGLITAPTR